MARRRRRSKSNRGAPKKHRKRVGKSERVAESRSAIAAAVLWMLSLMATVSAEILGVAFRIYSLFVTQNELPQVLGGVMLFVALLAGMVTLGMTPLVLRLTATKPTRGLVVFAGVAGCLPLVAVILQMVTRR